MPLTFGLQDVCLLVAFGHRDCCFLRPVGFSNDGAPASFGRHLTRHRLLDGGRRDDLADLDIRDLHTPTFSDLVELRAQDLVDLLPFCEHIVQADVTDDRTKRCRGDVERRAGEVLDRDDAHHRIEDFVERDEVDRDGSVVLRDRRLVWDLEIELPEVDPLRPVDYRPEEHDPGPFRTDGATQAEYDEPLELANDLYRQRQEDEDHEEQDCSEDDQSGHRTSPSDWLTCDTSSGSTSSIRPCTPVTRTRTPSGTGPAAA